MKVIAFFISILGAVMIYAGIKGKSLKELVSYEK